ncbi:MAG: metalloregulator ArsR/SmtB family transcription factor [Pseudomonadota bacterium]
MDQSEQLDLAFAALAHPTRRAILARLAKGAATVSQLAEPFEMSLPAISKHIRVLDKAGLIEQGRDAQFRPCKLNPKPLKAVAGWTEHYRHIWEGRFETMNEIITELKGGPDE